MELRGVVSCDDAIHIDLCLLVSFEQSTMNQHRIQNSVVFPHVCYSICTAAAAAVTIESNIAQFQSPTVEKLLLKTSIRITKENDAKTKGEIVACIRNTTI